MAKSSKPTNDAIPADVAATSSVEAKQNSVSPALSEKAPTKKSATSARKRTPATARKTSATAKAKKAPARKKAKPAEFVISDEDIRLRAYFIAQHRALSGLSGDSAGDWIEARRQLFEEAARGA